MQGVEETRKCSTRLQLGVQGEKCYGHRIRWTDELREMAGQTHLHVRVQLTEVLKQRWHKDTPVLSKHTLTSCGSKGQDTQRQPQVIKKQLWHCICTCTCTERGKWEMSTKRTYGQGESRWRHLEFLILFSFLKICSKFEITLSPPYSRIYYMWFWSRVIKNKIKTKRNVKSKNLIPMHTLHSSVAV
jgi:hypothetical protein